MIKLAFIFVILLTVSIGYANFYDPGYDSRNRAKRYDWHGCVAINRDPCVNLICPVSEDRDCTTRCLELSRAKCIEDGVKPPSTRELEYQ